MSVNSYLCEGVGGVEHLTIRTKKNKSCIYVTFKLYQNGYIFVLREHLLSLW